jgi:WD40 repeat protein
MSLGGFLVAGGVVSAVNPAGTEVAAGYGNGTVAVFDAATGRKLRMAVDGSAPVNDVAFLGGTGTIAIASQQNLALWQPGSRCCDVLLNASATTVAADPVDPRRFVSTAGGAAISWTIGGSGQPQQVLLGSLSSPVFVNDAGFSPDGSKIVTAESDGNIKIYTLATPRAAPTTLDAGDADALTTAFSPNGKQIVAGYSSGTARVWDIATRLPVTLLAGNASGVLSAQFSTMGDEIVTAGEDGTIRVWYAKPRELRAAFTIPPGGGMPNPITDAGYLGDRIIATDLYGHLEVFTALGEQQATINERAGVTSAAWDGAGTKIVTADTDGALSLWQATGPGYVRVFPPLSVGGLGEVGMSADGSRLADQAGPSAIQVRSTDTGQVLRTLSAFGPINVLAVGPGGRQVVAGDAYGLVEVWNGAGIKVVLGTFGPPVLDVAYSQSGGEFVSASANGIVTVWDAADAWPLLSVSACQLPGTASFSPDGSKIVVGCGDGTVRVFETATGRLLVSLPATGVGVISAAAFSPDGRSIVAAINAGNTGYVQVLSSELATPSLAVLEVIARRSVPQLLTPAQQQYINGSGG